ncbi:MAG: enolase C-terminal domain-like protein, partial [Kiloniellales bacterium]|nr:enolase C-terminal domain-like protein [Kiloniellales bacterium]
MTSRIDMGPNPFSLVFSKGLAAAKCLYARPFMLQLHGSIRLHVNKAYHRQGEGGGEGMHPHILRLNARAVVAPLARPIRTASGSIPAAPLVLIDVESDQGVTGHAYIFGYTPKTLVPLVTFIENLNDLLAGKTAAPAKRMAEMTVAFRLLGRQGLVGMALSGVEMALWDLLGQSQNLPVVALLGGEAEAVPAYDSYGIVAPSDDRENLEQSLAQGFTAIKIKLGESDGSNDEEVVAGVRDIIGPEAALMVDYNQSLDPEETLRRLDLLAPYDLTWVEEPVPAEDLIGHAKIREASPIPIQTGENWWFPSDMAKAIAAGASDYAMPDLMKIGGISGWLSAMALAEAA